MDESIVEPAETPEEPRCVQIKATLAGKINLADFQNAVPIVHELSLANETDDDIEQLRLTASSEPSFFKPKTWRLDHIAAGTDVRIRDLDLSLDGALLGRLTESERAVITFRLTTGLVEPVELASFESTVELLPRNQWGGLSALPDMVAAFVQPNEPAIERVLKKAADVLHKAGNWLPLYGAQLGRWGSIMRCPRLASNSSDRKYAAPVRLSTRALALVSTSHYLCALRLSSQDSTLSLFLLTVTRSRAFG
jgi:hypothetical protein